MIVISSNFIFNVTDFCVTVSFLTKLLVLGILFSKALRTVILAKLVILGIFFNLIYFSITSSSSIQVWKIDISFLTSFILALRVVLAAKLLISGMISSICLVLALYTSFLTTSFFTTLFSLLKSTETGTNLQHLIYLFSFQILELVGTFLKFINI